MAALKPAYMSVTYGATGGTSDYTVKLAEEVRNNNIPAFGTSDLCLFHQRKGGICH